MKTTLLLSATLLLAGCQYDKPQKRITRITPLPPVLPAPPTKLAAALFASETPSPSRIKLYIVDRITVVAGEESFIALCIEQQFHVQSRGYCDTKNRMLWVPWSKTKTDRNGNPLPDLESLGHELLHLPDMEGLWHD